MAGKRGNKTVRNMILSLAAVAPVVAVVYMFTPHDGTADPLKAVDYRVELQTARRAAPYPVAAPVGLPDGWKATSVSYDGAGGNAWHLGFLSPEGRYVAVEQSTAPAKKFISSVSQQATKTDETQQVKGVAWERWEGSKYDALVRQDKGSTTVVTGTAPYEQLAQMAAALESKQR
ncbi:DUF4245 domain-containing protein [Streptomyces sannanensis]|uniref:DUF4245 domain-containing protein n=1 Tax=Streptomyces sannanensis TaxID=285536 RepID=A0ABP6SFB8_9ACTN